MNMKSGSCFVQHSFDHFDGVTVLAKVAVNRVDLLPKQVDGALLQAAEGRTKNWMQHFELKPLGELVAVGHPLAKVYHKLHRLRELIVKKLEELGQVFADRQVLLLVVDHRFNTPADLFTAAFLFPFRKRNEGEIDRDNFFNLHKLFPCGIVEASLLLDGVRRKLSGEFWQNLDISSWVHLGKGSHSFGLFDFLRLLAFNPHDVEDPVAKVDEGAKDDELDRLFRDDVLEKVLLVGPVEEEDQSLPEVELVVKVRVVVDEAIDQVL